MSVIHAARAVRAPAKVNLCLEILGRRADGYHELATVFQALDLYDDLQFAPLSSLSLAVDGDAPTTEENLVLRAAQALGRLAPDNGAAVKLCKRIPSGAGLGGGSSDAAATLLALRSLWGVEISDEALVQLAAGLGADVPVFTYSSPAAFARGRGDVITPLPAAAELSFALTVPPFTLPAKTARIFSELRPEEYSDGSRARQLAETMSRGETPHKDHLWNGLFSAACRAFSNLEEYSRALRCASGRAWTLSGAGPTLFHLTAGSEDSRDVVQSVRSLPGTHLAVRSGPSLRSQNLGETE